MSLAPKKSIRPKPRPAGLAEEAELRAMVNRANRAANREGADLPENMKKKSGGMVKKMAMGGKISEYGGREKYASKASMAKHEKAESPSAERAEKMAGGGMCRGMGAAKRGGGYKKNG